MTGQPSQISAAAQIEQESARIKRSNNNVAQHGNTKAKHSHPAHTAQLCRTLRTRHLPPWKQTRTLAARLEVGKRTIRIGGRRGCANNDTHTTERAASTTIDYSGSRISSPSALTRRLLQRSTSIHRARTKSQHTRHLQQRIPKLRKVGDDSREPPQASERACESRTTRGNGCRCVRAVPRSGKARDDEHDQSGTSSDLGPHTPADHEGL